jgi:type IV secretory pathway VirB10-like protein
MMEEMMPFSLSSYLLGVGTVVGALAFGFGGGVLLTKTAMKDSSPAESRVERVARAEPASPPPQAVEAKSIPTPPVEPRPPAASLPEVQANTEPPKPVAEAPKEAAPARTAESMSQTEPKKPAEPSTKPLEQSTKPLEQSTKPADQKEAELRKAEERNKRFAERRARDIAAARARQRQFEEVRESSRPVYAYEREEPRSNLFEMPLFGRSRDTSPFDRDD